MKVFTYLILMITITLLTNFFGFNTGSQAVLNIIGVDFANGTVSITNSQFYTSIAAIILVSIVGGLIIGAFTRSAPENYLIFPILATLVLFVQSFTGVISYAMASGNQWAAGILVVIFVPLTVGFLLSLIEFFRGTD